MSFVYFVQSDAGPIKVGLAMNVEKRLSVLQTHCPHKLRLIGSKQGEYQHEGWVQYKFRQWRLRGEWFNSNPLILKEISDILDPEFEWPQVGPIRQNDTVQTPEMALKRAVEAAGGPTALGRQLGISGEAIVQWGQVPPRRVLEVERLTGVAKELLRPDLYR